MVKNLSKSGRETRWNTHYTRQIHPNTELQERVTFLGPRLNSKYVGKVGLFDNQCLVAMISFRRDTKHNKKI